MKKIFLIVLSFFSFISFSQESEKQNAKKKLIWVEKTCQGGDEAAKSDFNKGIYNAYSYGLRAEITPKEDEGFEEFYDDYMRKKHSINFEHKGCLITEYSDCYSKTMDKLIAEKFGTNIFEKTRKEAKILFVKK